MSAYQYVRDQVIPATFALLHPNMRSPEARAMLLAIGLQESRFQYRAQIGGPARGFWQFEEGGGWRGVLNHSASATHAATLLDALVYEPPNFNALEHNDVLACGFARLLLWTSPARLPGPGEAQASWDLYNGVWRPGAPHPETWPDFWRQAWQQ